MIVRAKAKTRFLISTALIAAGSPMASQALAADYGIFVPTGGPATIENPDGTTVEGDQSGVYSRASSLTLDNGGTIRGNGSYDGFDRSPEGGVTIEGGPVILTNSGLISGAGYGVSTINRFDPATGSLQGLAVGSQVTNTGTIRGEINDGVRLIGGGSITNSGLIEGVSSPPGGATDGVSMFAFNDQNLSGQSSIGSIANQVGGTIRGARFAAILSGGGAIDNAGTMTGGAGGILIQTSNATETGKIGTVSNSGTISGGNAISLGGNLDAAQLLNSGTINGTGAYGVVNGATGQLTITNAAEGTITGAQIGVYDDEGGIDLINAGTIRGNGNYDGFERPPEGGVTIAGRPSTITNSGTISGAGHGISTASKYNPTTDTLEGRAAGSTVTNSGTIIGETNDAIRLIGGGNVTNSGTITAQTGAFSDGASMFAYADQDQSGQTSIGSIVNQAGGTIRGVRFAAILSGGGAIDNAGTMTGGTGGIFIQTSNATETGKTGTVSNSGTISGGNAITFGGNLDAAQLLNSGTINGTGAYGVINGSAGKLTITNAAEGTISGAQIGVYVEDGGIDLNNAGTIRSDTGVAFSSLGAVTLINSGTLAGSNGIAAMLSDFDDSVTLRTGSAIDGLVDAGDGFDSLRLEGDVLELTQAQQISASSGFEALAVASGYWTTAGYVGEFDNVTISEGAALQVNEVDLGAEGLSSPILTSAVTTNGRLMLNFGEDDAVSQLDTLSITGTGSVQLIGEAVFTIDSDVIAHTGGTIVSNGGLTLTGSLLGDVVTEGDGIFTLGAGGTEGNFSGNLVNNGQFVFNRSDDYDFLGAFSGSGALDKLGDGILTFMGDYSFTGITNIMGGAVRIGGLIDPETSFELGDGGTLDITGQDQTIGGLSGDAGSTVAIGNNQLTVDQDDNSEFAGAIAGAGGFAKEGGGTLNLTGNSDYSGPTSVNGGTLAVNGSIASPVTVNNGGTLGGNGAVGSTTVGSGGTIAPGNSIGRLTVTGNLAFAAGSVYEVEVNAAGAGDRLDATGTVSIASTARVAVLAENGNYNPRTDYIILTGAGGVSGTFGSVTTDLAFLDPFLRYGPNAVTLSLYRNTIDFADVAVGFNQTGVARAIQARGIDDPLFEAVLIQNAAGAQAAYGELSGEILASTISGLTDDSRHIRNALLAMPVPENSGAFVWGSAFGSWGNFDAQVGGLGMDTDHKGLVTGIGYGGNGFAAALSAGIGNSDFRLDGRDDHAKVDSKYLAAHATYGAAHGLRGSLGLSYAWHDVETTRTVTFAPLAQTLASHRDADTLQLFGEVGYDLTMGKAAVTPFARLAHVRTKSDAFIESGGNAALAVAEAKQETTFFSLGARARFNADEPGFQPYASAAWNRVFDDRAVINRSALASGGTSFAIAGTLIPKNSTEIEAGFDYRTGAFSVGVAYTGVLASDRNSHGVRLTARISF